MRRIWPTGDCFVKEIQGYTQNVGLVKTICPMFNLLMLSADDIYNSSAQYNEFGS
jgi:hypothetical protein